MVILTNQIQRLGAFLVGTGFKKVSAIRYESLLAVRGLISDG